MIQLPGPERLDDLVQTGADPRHLGLGDPRTDPQRAHQIINGTSGHTGHIGPSPPRTAPDRSARRGSRMDGKNDPLQSLGIFNSMSPACVATKRGRDPLRSVTRLSARS